MRAHRRVLVGFAVAALAAMPAAVHAADAHHGDHGGHGQPVEQLGEVHFPVSCTSAAQERFDRAVALLHSFWFTPAREAFDEVLAEDPDCAMAEWGKAVTAMGNPLAGAPHERSLEIGAAAVERARAIGAPTEREQGYIEAIGAFYDNYQERDHRTRAVAYEEAMEALAARHPDDREAAIFYALALNITLDPTDQTYANQLKAARALEEVFREQPNHPGVAHYLIHSYDFPPLAEKGLEAAMVYADIAPSAPHALHMPSHIFTRLGYWQESIDTNRASKAAAIDELRQAQLDVGDYNALHAMDYIVYAALQLGKDAVAQHELDEVRRIERVGVDHFASAFAFAAIPARYALERRDWAKAAELTLHPESLDWERFPQAESMLWFARGLGAARGGDPERARDDLARLEALRDRMAEAGNAYWAEQTEIQRLAVAGWIAHAEGRSDEAVALMTEAADREDATEKHPVTPGPLLPAREMLGDLLLELDRPEAALAAYEASQENDPNRFHGLAGAAQAARAAGDHALARDYARRLVELAGDAAGERPEIDEAKAFLAAAN